MTAIIIFAEIIALLLIGVILACILVSALGAGAKPLSKMRKKPRNENPDIPINVKCDKCGWRREKESIHDWYGVGCPECGKSIIINDEDLAAYAGILGVVAISKALIPPKDRGKTVKLYVDTSPLRTGGKISIERIDP